MTSRSFRAATLRPGYLIGLSTKVAGNVTYRRIDIEEEHITDDGEARARWETEKRVKDAAEHEAAIKVRTRCRTLIVATCAPSSFGLLCPEDNFAAFQAAVTEAQGLAATFNDTAAVTKIAINVIAGRVEQNDLQAVRAINSEVRGLLEEMAAGVQRLDVERIRDAANRARQLGQVLSTDAQSKIADAISAARSAARRIVKAAETASVEVDKATLRTIASARAQFLDLDGDTEVAAPVADTSARAIDLPPVVDLGAGAVESENPGAGLEDAPSAEDAPQRLLPLPTELAEAWAAYDAADADTGPIVGRDGTVPAAPAIAARAIEIE